MTTWRTPVAGDGAPRGNPLVGIWWDEGSTLVALAHSPTEGSSVQAGFIDSNLAHSEQWHGVAGRFSKSAKDEYFSVPRGRVLMRFRSGRCVIYHGSATTPARLKVIAAEFHLTQWKADLDPHYEMGDAVDDLFDDGW